MQLGGDCLKLTVVLWAKTDRGMGGAGALWALIAQRSPGAERG